jgi:ferredoxin
MKTRALDRSGVTDFVQWLMKSHEVVAPVEKEKGYYAFGPIHRAEEVVLDYVTTLLPPKKAFFPQHQTLFWFKMEGELPQMVQAVDDRPLVLLGVHPCDLAGIRMLDWAFQKDHADEHYLARRRATTIIGVDCHPDEHCFCSSVGSVVPKGGYDLFLTPADGGYLVETGTELGEALARDGKGFREVRAPDVAGAGRWRQEKQAMLKRSFGTDIYNLPLLFQRSVQSPVWARTAQPCFSCGSCNLVCPTCFCFDVKDNLELDGRTGVRERRWDACQVAEFATVAGGHNFRKKPEERLRHRFYRKYSYLMPLYGEPFCTGCGRCGRACLAEINIVDTINALVEDDRART